MWTHEPEHPRREAAEAEAARVADRAAAPDRRHLAAVADRRTRGAALRAARRADRARDEAALLHRDRREARQRRAVRPARRAPGRRARTPPGGRAAPGRAPTSTRPSRSVGRPSALPSGDACTPAAQSVVAASMRSRADLDAGGVDARDRARRPHLHAERLEVAHGAARERLGEARQDARPGLDQDHARERRDRCSGSRARA